MTELQWEHRICRAGRKFTRWHNLHACSPNNFLSNRWLFIKVYINMMPLAFSA
jgi:hypothetical protein